MGYFGSPNSKAIEADFTPEERRDMTALAKLIVQLCQVTLNLAFFQAKAQNGSGYQPCLWRKPEVWFCKQLALQAGLKNWGDGRDLNSRL